MPQDPSGLADITFGYGEVTPKASLRQCAFSADSPGVSLCAPITIETVPPRDMFDSAEVSLLPPFSIAHISPQCNSSLGICPAISLPM